MGKRKAKARGAENEAPTQATPSRKQHGAGLGSLVAVQKTPSLPSLQGSMTQAGADPLPAPADSGRQALTPVLLANRKARFGDEAADEEPLDPSGSSSMGDNIKASGRLAGWGLAPLSLSKPGS